MHNKLASEYFSRKYRLGCAQAVTKAFQQDLNFSNEYVASLSIYGVGQAPNGTCGAIYAALELCTSEEQKCIKKAGNAGSFNLYLIKHHERCLGKAKTSSKNEAYLL